MAMHGFYTLDSIVGFPQGFSVKCRSNSTFLNGISLINHFSNVEEVYYELSKSDYLFLGGTIL